MAFILNEFAADHAVAGSMRLAPELCSTSRPALSVLRMRMLRVPQPFSLPVESRRPRFPLAWNS